MAIKVMIVDDHEVVRQGLKTLLSGSGVEIVAEAAGGAEALRVAKKAKPQVILLDIQMPGGDGIEALKKLKQALPKTAVVMLSNFDNPTYIARAFTHGAADYVLKGSSRKELVASVKAAAKGDGPQGGSAQRVAGVMEQVAANNGELGLTQREGQVLRHIALGLSNKEIGKSLDISVETVKEHVQNLLKKIPAGDRTEAAVWALKKQLV